MLPGSRRISSDQPAAANRKGRNDLPRAGRDPLHILGVEGEGKLGCALTHAGLLTGFPPSG
jgi:hypothetical protein